MKDLHKLRLREFAKHLNKKEFLKHPDHGIILAMNIRGSKNEKKFSFNVQVQKYHLEALIIFEEWNHNARGELIYERMETGSEISNGIFNFFQLTPAQLAHIFDIQNGKYQRTRLFGGKKMNKRCKGKDFAYNINQLLEKLN